ncbi:Uma2 family endonuclease [uncultured Thiocystis sp.]|uniref:Uma2 family endonuclease n=1 Tax=uncultured Thiocystis sp. TaxID=1202134 RepID=UPI0025EFD059|nr:Uma2 family endonuclease [uncultured Thiocystis sp.]
MALAQRDTDPHTYADYLTWTDEVRYELIDGVAWSMAPAPSLAHQEVAGEIYVQLVNALRQHPCRPFIAPLDVRLPKNNEEDARIDTVVQPDVLVVCDPAKLDWRGVRGAPDLVVEVLSPGTASHDHWRKRQVYERAGVREYWLVHPIDRLLTIYRLVDGQFGKPEVGDLVGATPVGILPGVVIVWDELSARLPPVDP